MKIIGARRRVSPFLIAIVLLLPLSPALATGQPDAQQAAIQGNRFPGMPVASKETTKDRRRGPIEVTFTKWGIPGTTFLEGIAGGDVDGRFLGEVLQGQTSVHPELNPNPEGVPGPLVNGVRRLEAVYQVNAENANASFTALIRGGQNQVTGVGRLTGFVVAGRRSGAEVRVEYQRYPAGDPHCLDAGAPVTATCFQGVIRVERAPEE
jgi:hypothetical protein